MLATFILDFLTSLAVHSPHVLLTLYDDAWAVHGVFRGLPPLAKNIVMRMAYLTGPVASSSMVSWTRAESSSAALARDAMAKLYLLRILHIKSEDAHELDAVLAAYDASTPGNEDAMTAAVGRALKEVYAPGNLLSLHPAFQASLQAALCGSAPTPWLVPGDIDALHGHALPDPEELDAFAEAKWDAVLKTLLGTVADDEYPDAGVEAILVRAGLLEIDDDTVVRTPAGSKYLLEDVYTQIWTLLVEYISVVEEANMDMADVIRFLFVLTFQEVGRPYRLDALTQLEQEIAAEFNHLGLIYLPELDDKNLASSTLGSSRPSLLGQYYFPTKLATHLMAGMVELDDAQRYIVVETNFGLYAYTDSQLKLNILALFADITCRLPNLVVGQITRASVTRAFDNGITSEEILSYLSSHAHSQMSLLPSLVDAEATLGDMALLAAGSPLVSASTAMAVTQAKRNKVDPQKASAGPSSPQQANEADDDAHQSASAVEIAQSYYYPLPEVITDQVKLWEQELSRIISVPGVVAYRSFPSTKVMETAIEAARELGALVFVSRSKCVVLVKESAVGLIDNAIDGMTH